MNPPLQKSGSRKLLSSELETLARETDYVDLALFPVDPRLGKDYTREPGICRPDPYPAIRSYALWEKYEKANAFREYVEKRAEDFWRSENQRRKNDKLI